MNTQTTPENDLSKLITKPTKKALLLMEDIGCINPTAGLVLLGSISLKDGLSKLTHQDLETVIKYGGDFVQAQLENLIQTNQDLEVSDKISSCLEFDHPLFVVVQHSQMPQAKEEFEKTQDLDRLFGLYDKFFGMEIFGIGGQNSTSFADLVFQKILRLCGDSFDNVKDLTQANRLYYLYDLFGDTEEILQKKETLQKKIDEFAQKDFDQADSLSKLRELCLVDNLSKNMGNVIYLKFKAKLLNNIQNVDNMYDIDYLLVTIDESNSDYRIVLSQKRKVLQAELQKAKTLNDVHRINGHVQSVVGMLNDVDGLDGEIHELKDWEELAKQSLAMLYEVGKLELKTAKSIEELKKICQMLDLDLDDLESCIVDPNAKQEKINLARIAISKKEKIMKSDTDLEKFIKEERRKNLIGRTTAKDISETLKGTAEREFASLIKLYNEYEMGSANQRKVMIFLKNYLGYKNIKNFDNLLMIYLLDNPEFDEFCLEERILEVATLNDAQSLSNLVFAYPELKLETMLFKLLKSRVEIAISPKQTSRILDICSKFVLEDQEYQAVVENLKKTGKTPEISNKKWKNLKQKAINQSKKISGK